MPSPSSEAMPPSTEVGSMLKTSLPKFSKQLGTPKAAPTACGKSPPSPATLAAALKSYIAIIICRNHLFSEYLYLGWVRLFLLLN